MGKNPLKVKIKSALSIKSKKKYRVRKSIK